MQCFTLPYLYCMYSPAIAHPHYSPWLFSFYSSYCGLHCAQAPAPSRSSKAWASQDNATLRQSDRKRLKSFLAGTGETSKQCHKNRQMLWLCFTRFYIGTSTHTHTDPFAHIQTHTCLHREAATHGTLSHT